MVRRVLRRTRARTAVVMVATFTFMSSGLPPLFAQARPQPSRPSSRLATTVAALPNQPAPHEIEAMRLRLLELRDSKDPKVGGRAARALQWLDIARATTATARHEAIRRLPVTITRSAPVDGRRGTVKSYASHGKVRLQVFVPEVRRAVAIEEGTAAGDQGPSASGTGRWKDDGQGGCYWDPYDDGPNQCEPPPEPPTETCYDGEPPCLTDQETEDLEIAVAAAEAEVDMLQQEIDAEAAAYEQYCNQNPWDCDDGVPLSGPSAGDMWGCGFKTTTAVAGVAAAAFNVGVVRGGITAAAMSGLKLTAFGAFVMYGAMAAGVAVAGLLVYDAVQCYRYPADPVSDWALEPVEPIAVSSLK